MKKIKARYFVLMACLVMIILTPGCIDTDPRTKPGAPSNLVGIAISYRTIQLTWQDNSNDEDGFKVACNTHGGSNYYEIGDLLENTTTFVYSGLDPLETFNYYIQAYNAIGEANSNVVEVTTLSGVTILDYALGERQDGTAFVTGHARNDTNEEMDWVEFTACYYDAFGVLVSRHRSLIDDIPGGTTFEFEVRSSVPRASVARFDIEVTDVDIYEKWKKRG